MKQISMEDIKKISPKAYKVVMDIESEATEIAKKEGVDAALHYFLSSLVSERYGQCLNELTNEEWVLDNICIVRE